MTQISDFTVNDKILTVKKYDKININLAFKALAKRNTSAKV
jgi:hypothetical protein